MPFLIPVALLGQIAIWGTSIGLSLTAVTGLLTAVSYGITAAIGLGLSYLGNALFAPSAPKPEQRQGMVREPTHPRFRLYGESMVGGVLSYLLVDDGDLYRVLAMGHGEIDSVQEHWIDDQQLTLNGSGVSTAPSKLSGRIKIDYRLGTASQTAYSDLVSVSGGQWTTAHQGNGFPHALVKLESISLKNFSSTYPRGEPNYRQVQRGAKVYDPRTAVTQYSDNAALIIRDFLTHPDGMNLDASFVASDTWQSAADDCDDAIALKAGGTTPRYRLSCFYDFSERPAEVLARLLRACDGRIFPTADGGLGLTVGKWVTPAVTIDDDAVTDYDMGRGKPIMEGANVIKATFLYPVNQYQSAEADEWRDETDITARGELVAKVDFICAPIHSQCRRLMKIESYRMNPSWSGTVTCNLRGLAVLGQRFINLDLTELGIAETFEIVSDPEIILGDGGVLMGVRFVVSAISSAAYDWDAVTEEGIAPPADTDLIMHDGVPDMTGLDATVEQRTVSGDNKVAVAVLTWDATANDSLSPNIQIKLHSESSASWRSLPVTAGSNTTETGILIDGETYDYQGRWESASGKEGNWTVTASFVATANLTPPADVTDVTLATLAPSSVTLGFTTPNDVNFVKARIYRKQTNSPSTATYVQDVFLARNVIAGVTLASAPLGTWYYWVAASNGSNIEATRVAPTPASILIMGPELVSNGDFAAGAGWTTGTGWSIGGGTATHAAGTAADLSQTVTLTAGHTYRVVFTVSSLSGGTVTPKLTGGTTVTGTARSANGTYTEDLVAVSGNTTLVLAASSAGAFDIDDVSVKQID